MPHVRFASLPDAARIWVFGASQPLVGRDAELLIARADDFVRGWQAHGAPVVGACDWRYDHFLLVAADEEATGVSGCSVDSLFRSLRRAEAELGAALLDSSPVWYRDQAGAVRSTSRAEFRELASRGEIHDWTTVFDNTVGTVGALRAGEWERPFAESWHGRAFGRQG